MKLPSIRKHTRMLGLMLPAMVVLTLCAYIVLGAIPGALLTGDYIAALAQVPVITVHAFAAIGCAWLYDRWTHRDLGDDDEEALLSNIRTGDVLYANPALGMLWLDFARRFLPLVAFLIFFYPSR